MLNNFEIGFSMTVFVKEFYVVPLCIGPQAEIHSLCKVQILQVLIRATSLL